jgi:hypothetical protein
MVNKVITPEMKVAELLGLYPELEKTLLDLSPAFKKFQNPVLRRTVAKVTTLQHAAKVGGLDLGTLINRLRISVGQEEYSEEVIPQHGDPNVPEWLSVDCITQKIDVRPILEAGEKPVGRVMLELGKLEPGKICELTAPFLPAPLIDMAIEKGFESWHREESREVFKVYFLRPNQEDSANLVSLE